MDDLRVEPGPGAGRGMVVPASELSERFTHASGPGGQGVNTTDSRVQLSLDIGTTTALDEDQRDRALDALSGRLAGTALTINASEHRSQHRNRLAARKRLADLLRSAVAPESVRKETRPTRASKQRRLDAKRARSQVKQARRRPRLE